VKATTFAIIARMYRRELLKAYRAPTPWLLPRTDYSWWRAGTQRPVLRFTKSGFTLTWSRP